MTSATGSKYLNYLRVHPVPWRALRVTQTLAATMLVSTLLGNAAAQSQTETAQTSRTQADAELADFAATYESRLTAEQVTLFRLSQTAWDASRRADCAFRASSVERGSAYPGVIADCLASAAQARLEALQTLAQCEEGDLACPASMSE